MSTSNMQSIKHSNYSDIYHLLYDNEKLSKQDIADQLNLSLPTVSSNLQKLTEQKLIVKNGQLKSLIGRRATAYSIDPNVSLSIGVEIFAHRATLAVLNLKNEVMALQTSNLDFANDDQYAQALAQAILTLVQEHGFSQNQIAHVGIGIQGLIDGDGTTILYGKILNCTGMKAATFAQYLPFPVTFYHDADCVARAEYSQHPTDGIFLSIGEHIGTAVIVNGHMLNSPSGRNGTMEHITLNASNGPVCYCGRRGCIETYCSLHSLLHEDESCTDFFDQLAQGVPAVSQRFDQYLDYLAAAIYNLHMFVDIPLVIAGNLTKYLTAENLADLKQRLKQRSVFPETESYLRLGTVNNHAVAIGAAIPAIRQQLQDI
ncbi:ROK family transcriptional regulator [Levilactobacillus suantsaiihabitans]|uniref:ROK family transcriptional regulator n=1 Tax=Levilactobacillus suantsaiihabitans TaxID=2487722 RepID=A0A4Z0JED7_9LACO|nr:ROK family transcriptional regulator [Levilactobacillus suantsaiihabitans]TGD20407.1 ROK family transcriptional regulator [Levilactobacillus suantsaiihabitans]